MVDHQVGSRSYRHGVPRHRGCLGVPATRRQDFRPHCAPRDRRLQVAAREALALGRVPVGLVDPALRENRPREKCGRQTGIGADTQRVQTFQSRAKVRLGGDRVAFHRLDDPREQLGFHQSVTQAEVLDELAGIAKHRAGLVGSSPQQLENCQVAHRCRFKRRCGRRHSLHPDHVEAPAACLRHRARSPQCRTRRRTQRSRDLPVVPALTRGDQRLEEVDFGVADPAETEPRARAHPVRLGQSRSIVTTAELVDGALQTRIDFQ